MIIPNRAITSLVINKEEREREREREREKQTKIKIHGVK
jgi:hypothetical protein